MYGWKKAGKSDDLYCNEEGVCREKNNLCTEPITADGNVLKIFLSVNKQFPGPTLIVHEGQIVAVDVHNNLSSEGITIHWHGQHQIKTNFMDGEGLVAQCPILPGSYIFRAGPSGTFWYHSQMGSQRGNSLFGALIVKEKGIKYPVSFIDNPASHTIMVMDWYRQDPEEFFQHKKIAVGWLRFATFRFESITGLQYNTRS
jgi:FtsP/CotA-like multicopper oxidase with cupredoxin domain